MASDHGHALHHCKRHRVYITPQKKNNNKHFINTTSLNLVYLHGRVTEKYISFRRPTDVNKMPCCSSGHALLEYLMLPSTYNSGQNKLDVSLEEWCFSSLGTTAIFITHDRSTAPHLTATPTHQQGCSITTASSTHISCDANLEQLTICTLIWHCCPTANTCRNFASLRSKFRS